MRQKMINAIPPGLFGPSLAMFFCANALFTMKYAPRVGLTAVVGIVAYFLFVAFILASIPSITRAVAGQSFLINILLVSLFVVLFFLVLANLDPANVKVDRWSAMVNFNRELLSGNFPYLARTHLGQKISGLPGLFFIALPFQLFGDVGYLQIFSFICFCVMTYAIFTTTVERFSVAILLATSPGFLWEVAARSDLFSNLALFLLFTWLGERLKAKKSFLKMAACGMFGGLLLSTRIVLAIPFLIYFVHFFKKAEWRQGAWFLSIAGASFLATLGFLLLWNDKLFMQNNPFTLQLRKIPAFVAVISIAAAATLGVMTKNFWQYCFYSGAILFAIVAVAFVFSLARFGWNETLFQHRFDISYFQFAVPFLLITTFKSRDELDVQIYPKTPQFKFDR
jgi:hypothetical protein